MTPDDSARLGGLLHGQRLVSLGVVAEGEPIVGLLPYAVADDSSALIVQSWAWPATRRAWWRGPRGAG